MYLLPRLHRLGGPGLCRPTADLDVSFRHRSCRALATFPPCGQRQLVQLSTLSFYLSPNSHSPAAPAWHLRQQERLAARVDADLSEAGVEPLKTALMCLSNQQPLPTSLRSPSPPFSTQPSSTC